MNSDAKFNISESINSFDDKAINIVSMSIKIVTFFIAILLIIFSIILAMAIIIGLYYLFKQPENLALIQLVIESINSNDKLINGMVSGFEIDLTISKAILYVLLIIVSASVISAVATLIDVFCKGGIALFKLALEIQPDQSILDKNQSNSITIKSED